MPKITFRPNPTPPPFVPPGPIYDTQIEAVAEFQEYDENIYLSLKFSPSKVPPFNKVLIFRNNSLLAEQLIEHLPTSEFIAFETFNAGEVPFTGEIKFENYVAEQGQIVIWTAILEVSYP